MADMKFRLLNALSGAFIIGLGFACCIMWLDKSYGMANVIISTSMLHRMTIITAIAFAIVGFVGGFLNSVWNAAMALFFGIGGMSLAAVLCWAMPGHRVEPWVAALGFIGASSIYFRLMLPVLIWQWHAFRRSMGWR